MEAEMASLRGSQQGTQQADGQQTPRQERPTAPAAVDRQMVEYAKSVVEYLEDAGDAVEGFDKVMETITQTSFPISRVMMDFLGETKRPADMAKWLSENPGEALKISHKSDVMAVRALERAEAELLAKPAPRTTTAPPPVPTVGGRSTPSFDADKASMEDYAAHWKAQRGIK